MSAYTPWLSARSDACAFILPAVTISRYSRPRWSRILHRLTADSITGNGDCRPRHLLSNAIGRLRTATRQTPTPDRKGRCSAQLIEHDWCAHPVVSGNPLEAGPMTTTGTSNQQLDAYPGLAWGRMETEMALQRVRLHNRPVTDTPRYSDGARSSQSHRSTSRASHQQSAPLSSQHRSRRRARDRPDNGHTLVFRKRPGIPIVGQQSAIGCVRERERLGLTRATHHFCH